MPNNANPYPDWPGFEAPRYTPVPDDLFDLWLPYVTGAELKVLLYLMRRTFGWKKDADAVSLSQICAGITRRDGTPLDQGTGLSRSTALAAIAGLEAKRLIVAQRDPNAAQTHQATVYRVRMRGDSWIENRTSPGGGWIENRTSPGSTLDPALDRKSAPQEAPVQETENKRAEEAPLYSPLVAGTILDFGAALRDKGAPGMVTEALRLWQRSGLSESAFAEALLAARGQQRRVAEVLRTLAVQLGL